MWQGNGFFLHSIYNILEFVVKNLRKSIRIRYRVYYGKKRRKENTFKSKNAWYWPIFQFQSTSPLKYFGKERVTFCLLLTSCPKWISILKYVTRNKYLSYSMQIQRKFFSFLFFIGPVVDWGYLNWINKNSFKQPSWFTVIFWMNENSFWEKLGNFDFKNKIYFS